MVLSMDRWVGTVAVVTGASSGIGAATAVTLVNHGLKVVGLDRRGDRLEQLAEKLSNKKGAFYPFKTDVTKEEEILKAFQWIKENLGPVHVLVNNAGVMGNTSLVEGPTEIWKNVLDINVLGLSICTREAIKSMRANNVDGHIIHMNSIGGHAIPNIPCVDMYSGSKFAVRALAETLRQELGTLRSNIKITNLSPGLVDTELIPDALRNRVTSKYQMMKSEDIADSVVYVLSTPPHVQIQELIIRTVDERFFKPGENN